MVSNQLKIRAFGATHFCDKLATVCISFTNNKKDKKIEKNVENLKNKKTICISLSKNDENILSITGDFLILPDSSDSRLIFGKPLLKELNYRLTQHAEFITISDEEIDVSDSNIHFNAHYVDLFLNKINHSQMLSSYIDKYPRLFSDSISKTPQHSFSYAVQLENFDYHSPKPFHCNKVQEESIKKFINDGIKDNVLQTIQDSNSLVALAPIFPIVQNDKIRVVTDFKKINAH